MPEENLLSKMFLLPSVRNSTLGKASSMKAIPLAKSSDSPWPLQLGHASFPQKSAAL